MIDSVVLFLGNIMDMHCTTSQNAKIYKIVVLEYRNWVVLKVAGLIRHARFHYVPFQRTGYYEYYRSQESPAKAHYYYYEAASKRERVRLRI